MADTAPAAPAAPTPAAPAPVAPTPAAPASPVAEPNEFQKLAGGIFDGKDEPVDETEVQPTGTEPTASTAPPAPTAPVAPAAPVAPTAPAAPKEYTTDELNTMFKVWLPTAEFTGKLLGGGDAAVEAMVEMREALALQFETMQQYQRAALKQEILNEIAPALSLAKTHKQEAERTAFYGAHEDLKGHEGLVDIVFKAMLQEGFKAKTVEDARTALAERVRKLLPAGGGTPSPSVSPTTNGSQQQNNTQQPPAPTVAQDKRPAALSSGSQTGGGAGTGESATGNVFQDIWG